MSILKNLRNLTLATLALGVSLNASAGYREQFQSIQTINTEGKIEATLLNRMSEMIRDIEEMKDLVGTAPVQSPDDEDIMANRPVEDLNHLQQRIQGDMSMVNDSNSARFQDEAFADAESAHQQACGIVNNTHRSCH